MKKVLSLLKPHAGTLTMSILFAAVSAVMQLLLPAYTRDLQTGILNKEMDEIVRYSLMMLGFSAIGVAASPGMAEMPADASVEAAVSFSTVSDFSSMEAMVAA